MSSTTLTSRAFNQDTAGAKRAATAGPVFITDRGRPSHVLLNIDTYHRLTGQKESILDALAMPEEYAEYELELPRFDEPMRAADFD